MAVEAAAVAWHSAAGEAGVAVAEVGAVRLAWGKVVEVALLAAAVASSAAVWVPGADPLVPVDGIQVAGHHLPRVVVAWEVVAWVGVVLKARARAPACPVVLAYFPPPPRSY